MTIRPYLETDLEACQRIWQECGWAETDTLASYLSGGRAMVAELGGAAECLALAHTGSLRHLESEVSLCAVTGVTTSRVARRQGAATRTTAALLAAEAAAGQHTAMLGIFDQGFYNRLGFGNGAYHRRWEFDPAALRVPARHRPPLRFSVAEHADALLACRLGRTRPHGGVNLFPVEHFRSEVAWTKHSFGLGYRDADDGAISHVLWCGYEAGENGPYDVCWMAWRTREQLLELLAILASLADQVYGMTITEPAGVQFQDLLEQPFRRQQTGGGGKFKLRGTLSAAWQIRILNLAGCLAQTHFPGEPVAFNLALTDPISGYLHDTSPWRGLSGSWRVRLGPESSAEPGEDPSRPTLTASLGAFSRLWLGVQPATGLAITDRLSGPEPLLADLDRLCRAMPSPQPDWEF